MNHQEYFDQAATEWDELTEEEALVRLREIVAGLEIEPGAAVLDEGADTGVLLPLLLKKESRVAALDFSCEMLRRAQAKGHPVGGVVAHDTIPDEKAMRQLLREAGLREVRAWDEPDRYLALGQRGGW